MLHGATFKIVIDDYILMALREDITSEDVSANCIFSSQKMSSENLQGEAQLIAKEEGIICGLQVFERVFYLLDNDVSFKTKYSDGDYVENGTIVGTVKGDMSVILTGERTALNYLQRMSGIATMTNKYAEILKPYKTRLLDTRKTTPGMRIFEKYAVKTGGGCNHRYNLSDGVMLKDNHISAAGTMAKAVALAREYSPFVRKIEVETENIDMVKEALDAGADIIMLDNMDDDTMREAVKIIGTKAETECSGNVTIERLKAIGEIGVDYVSSGALTHSAPIMDLSLKNLHAI